MFFIAGIQLNAQENCTNGIDDDMDCLVDCEDEECGLSTTSYINGEAAIAVVGQPNFTSSTSGSTNDKFNSPYDVAQDPVTGKIFIADYQNNRVLRYKDYNDFINNVGAEAVLGQPDFTTTTAGVSAVKMSFPTGVFVDHNGVLWVSDHFNHRVLRFDNAATISSGSNADGVLGQPNFISDFSDLDQNSLNTPYDIEVDASGNLWVADSQNERVVRFSNAAALPNGANASLVLGAPDYTTVETGTNEFSMAKCQGLTIMCNTLFVGDSFNHRILIYKNIDVITSGSAADGVLGQTNFTTSTSGTTDKKLHYPSNLSNDGVNLLVSDGSNRRGLIFREANSLVNNESASTVIGQSTFTTSTWACTENKIFEAKSFVHLSDGNLSRLAIVDAVHHRVLVFGQSDYITDELTSVSGIFEAYNFNGSPSHTFSVPVQPEHGTVVITNHLTGTFTYTPTGLCPFDSDYEVLINYTVSNLNACAVPGAVKITVTDVATCIEDCFNGIDDDGDCLVDCDDSDCGSYPIKIENGLSAQKIVGQTDFVSGTSSTTASTFNSPVHITQDPISKRVFVTDYQNNRVLIYVSSESFIIGEDAIAVLGQFNFSANSSGTTANKFNRPSAIYVDDMGRLWVCDRLNNRVLWFDNAGALVTNASANGVIGQSGLTTATPATSATGLRHPTGVKVDENDNLWIADFYNERVLMYSNASTITTGASADLVLGAPDFISIGTGVSNSNLGQCSSLEISCNNLFVTDNEYNRVLIFEDAASLGNGAPADVVIGQPNMTSSTSGVTDSRYNTPSGLFIDNGLLYVSDQYNHRILVYKNAQSLSNGAVADFVIGQPNFTTSTSGLSHVKINGPHHIMMLEDKGVKYLTIADRANHRFLLFGAPTHTTDELTDISGTIEGISLTSDPAVTFVTYDSPRYGSISITNTSTGAFDYYPEVSCTNGEDYTEYINYAVSNSNGCNALNTVKIEVASVDQCNEICNNGLDDDLDGQIDHFDGNCDNDNDGVINELDRDKDNDGIGNELEHDLTPAQCYNMVNVPVFYDDFGIGERTFSDRVKLCYEHSGSVDCSPVYSASFTGSVDKGEYAIVLTTSEANGGGYTWVDETDHTGDYGDRLLVVHPSTADQLIYQEEIANVMPNVIYHASIEFLNLAPLGSGYTPPRMYVKIKSGVDEVQSIPISIPETGQWETLMLPVGIIDDDQVSFEIYNMDMPTANYAFALDRIILYQQLCDFDNDGIPNMMDVDSENDGIPDIIEQTNVDSDKNGMTDNIDGAGALHSDANSNGWDDNYELDTLKDTDTDGVNNFMDLDSDNDGVYDVWEANGTDEDNDGSIGTGSVTTNSNGYAASLDPSGSGTALIINDSDNDGVPDFLELDSDNDGCFDVIEAGFPDADADGILYDGVLGVDIDVDSTGKITP